MAKLEDAHDKESGSEVRERLSRVEEGARSEPDAGSVKVTASEIGTPPTAEESILAKEIHFFGPNNLDRAVFCRQLATMIEVGIPLLRALQLLAKRTSHTRLARAISEVAAEVEAGQSVSEAMKKNSRVFSPLVCNIVRVGEIGGILEGSLVRLAEIMESKADINRKVRAALMYPVIAVGVAIVVIGIIMVKAVPVFTAAYASAEQDLPVPTQIVIGVSDFVQVAIIPIIVLTLIAIPAGLYFIRTPNGQKVISFVSLKFPVLSGITRKISTARFSRTLSGLLSAGVPLIECIEITSQSSENTLVRDALQQVRLSVEKGEKIGLPLARARIFPPLVVDMVSIGEETGTLDRMLDRIADIYDSDVDSTLRGLSSIIEPMLIVVLGGVVVFIALAVMMPYFNLVDVV